MIPKVIHESVDAKGGLHTAAGDKQTYNQARTWRNLVLWIPLVVTLVPALVLRSLPNSYILCSKSKNIYTVNEDSPRVECISVRGSRIVDVGNLGMLYWPSKRTSTSLKLTTPFCYKLTFSLAICGQFLLSYQPGL